MRRIVFLLLIISALAASNAVARGMEFLTFDELRSLANSAEPTADEAARLDQLLITPLIVNDTSSTVGAGQIIRIVFWHINDGLEWPMIEAALRDPREFKARVERERVVSEEKWRKAAKELEDLRSADVIILNEVDLGMPRTAYANVAGELAGALRMNYAYGVESNSARSPIQGSITTSTDLDIADCTEMPSDSPLLRQTWKVGRHRSLSGHRGSGNCSCSAMAWTGHGTRNQ